MGCKVNLLLGLLFVIGNKSTAEIIKQDLIEELLKVSVCLLTCYKSSVTYYLFCKTIMKLLDYE